MEATGLSLQEKRFPRGGEAGEGGSRGGSGGPGGPQDEGRSSKHRSLKHVRESTPADQG